MVSAFVILAIGITAVRLQVFTHELPILTGIKYGFSGRRVYSMHEFSVLWTSQLLTRDAFMIVSLVLSLAITLAIYESIAGHIRALAVTVSSAIAGPLVVGGLLALGSLAGNGIAQRAMSTVDYGVSAVTAGAGGALAAIVGPRLRGFILFWLVTGSLLHHQIADAEHITAFALSFAVSAGWPSRRRASDRVYRVRRFPVTVAALIPVVALGLLASDLVTNRQGPAGRITIGMQSANSGTAHTRPTQLSQPRVEILRYPTPSIGGTQGVYVLLPAGYDATRTRQYPVVEILHGHPGTAVDVISGLDLAQLANTPGLPPFIAIAPEAVGPKIANGYFANLSGQALGEAVSVDLRAWATAKYRTSGVWSVTGLSAGGYGAAYLAMLHPDLYTAACPMSGEVRPDPAIMTRQPPQVREATNLLKHVVPNGPPMLLIVGSADVSGLSDARVLLAALHDGGQPGSILVVPGGHEWNMWRSQVGQCLKFLLDPRVRDGHVIIAA